MEPPSTSMEPRSGLPERLELLYALADHAQRARHVDLVYQETVEGLCRAVAADRSCLLVADSGLMRCAASWGLSEKCLAGLEGFAPWRPDARDARSVTVVDVDADARVDSIRETLVRQDVRSLACIPLLYRKRLLGEILLFRDRAAEFDPAEVRFAEAVAGHLAFAIWRARSDADQAELLSRFEAERLVLEAVVKQMPAGVLVADVPSGRIIMSNSRVQALWGRSLHTASQVSDYVLWGGLDATGTPLVAEDWPLARSVLYGTAVTGEEITIERGDGTRIVVRMSSAPVLDARGRPLAAVATVEDVTAARAEERRHAFLVEATRQLGGSLDVDTVLGTAGTLVVGRYADWCVLSRCRDPERVEGVRVVHADPAEVARLRSVVLGSAARDSEHPVARSIRIGRPIAVADPEAAAAAASLGSGPIPPELAPAAAAVLPLVARNQPLGALCTVRTRGRYADHDLRILRELADRVALAMDNALLYEQATTSDREKANFMAVMSHEFRTPLSAILGYADILTSGAHGELTARQRSHVERMKASVRHLSHLVEEILAYASMEAGHDRVRTERVDVVAVARDVAGIMEPIASAAGLELRVRAAVDRLEVVTDPSKLRQILINLLSNAVKYTAEGHVELVVEAAGLDARFRVIDTGPGIADTDAESIFEPFWQAGEAEGRRRSGTGLGLTVARRLARILGGDVRVKRVVARGSEFVVDLPRRAPDGVAGGATP
jgi:signal transduction histidine kinase/PAS domain-containing protein